MDTRGGRAATGEHPTSPAKPTGVCSQAAEGRAVAKHAAFDEMFYISVYIFSLDLTLRPFTGELLIPAPLLEQRLSQTRPSIPCMGLKDL